MKKMFLAGPLLAALALLLPVTSSFAQSAAESQKLAARLNQLMRNPDEPDQEVIVDLKGCHVVQTIRAKGKGQNAQSDGVALSVSSKKKDSEWSAGLNEKDGFTLRFGFDWSQVTNMSLEAARTDKGRAYYDLKIKRHTADQDGSQSDTTLGLPLFTQDEAVAQEMLRRLRKVQQSCSAKK